MSAGVTPSPILPGETAPKVILNGFSSGGYNAISMANIMAARLYQSGALVANVLSPVLTVNGPGMISFLSGLTQDATSRTMRMQLVIDGITVFDSVSAPIATSLWGGVVVGAVSGAAANPNISLDLIPFKTSFVLNMASSLSEASKFGLYAIYRTS